MNDAAAASRARSAAAGGRLPAEPVAVERLARREVRAARAAGDAETLGTALEVLGKALFAQLKNTEAARQFAAARGAFAAAGLRRRVAAIRLIEIGVHEMLGDRRQALACAAAARRIYTALGARDGLAKVAVNVGNVYQRCDRGHEAIVAYREARAQFLSHGMAPAAAVVALNLANVLSLLDNKDEAEELYRDADRVLTASGQPAVAAQARYNLAYLLFLQGRYREARDGFASSERFFGEAGDSLHVALCHLDRSEMWLEMGLLPEAERESGIALASFTTLGLGYERTRALTFNALARRAQGRLAGVASDLEQARAGFRRLGNSVWAATLDVHRAWLALAAGDRRHAGALARAARRVFDRLPLPVKRARALEVAAAVAAASGRTAQAATLLQAAVRAIRNDPSGFTEVRLRLARARLMGRGRRALAEVDRALDLLEGLHASAPPGTWEEALAQDREVAYREAVSLCLDMAKDGAAAEVGRAFLYAERARALSVLERLSLVPAPSAAAVVDTAPDEAGRRLLDELTRIRHQRWYQGKAAARVALEARPDTARLRRLRRADRGLRAQEASIITRMTTRHRRYAALHDLVPPTPESVAEGLAPGVILLEYVVTEAAIAVFELSRAGLRLHRLAASREAIRNELEGLQFQMNKYNFGPEYVDRHRAVMAAAATAHLRALGALLLGELAPVLRAADTVLVAPHDLLHYVPFHALVVDGRSLIDDHEVAVVPSSAVLRLCQRRARYGATGTGSLVVGVSDPATPSIDREVTGVARLLPDPVVLRDTAATWAAVRGGATGRKYVHIATHGIVRQDAPMASGLRLADRWLTFAEAAELSLSAELVVLSACHAGLDRLVSGDEQMGLGRALLEAGARSLITTLWAVGDASMTAWMERFYPALLAGATPARAFRAACLAARDADPHPHAWAPCVLTGYAPN